MAIEIRLPDVAIAQRIHVIREENVMLDSDLAELYQVETKRLNEQVRRNLERFPKDFMFQLTTEEWNDLKSQFATSSWGGRRTMPYAFTEHGILMLSSVLSSKRAIAVNIQVMRFYVKMREAILTDQEMVIRVNDMEKRLSVHDANISEIFGHLGRLVGRNEDPRRKIGFKR